MMKKNRVFKGTLLTATAIAGLTLGVNTVFASSDPNELDVQTQTSYRNVDHVASGGLYAMYDQSTPDVNLLQPLQPKTFTQAPPGGQQIPNGEPGPGGDFMNVVGNAHKLGAKVIIRLPDIYPKWPYNYSNKQDYLKRVTEMVNKAKVHHDDIYGYELWNEPNGTWQGKNGNGHGTWGDFYPVWQATYKLVKQLDPGAKIVGPSINSWQPEWMTNFLKMAKSTNTLPDIISWHQWGAASFPQQAAALDKIEDDLGISRRPISINEYGAKPELAVPGQMIHYVQNFENVKELDSADLAFWFNYGRMDNLLTKEHKPNGGYWLYKWYGDMTGKMVQTNTFKPNGEFASIANISDSKDSASVIFGGTNGNHTVNVEGLNNSKFNGSAKVEVESTPWYGVDTAVDGPTTEISGEVPVKDGKVSVDVKNMVKSSGYRLVVTPSDKKVTFPDLTYKTQKDTDPIRVEAESGTITGKAQVKKGSYASGNYYVGNVDDANSSDTMKFNTLKAGKYQVEIGYANANKDNGVDAVTLNGKSQKDAIFPYTTGWIDDSLNVNGTRRTMDYGTVDLNKGENTIKLTHKQNFAELDYVKFTPVDQSNSSSPNSSSSSSSSSANTDSINSASTSSTNPSSTNSTSSSVTPSTSSSSSTSSSNSPSSSETSKNVTNKMTKAIYAKRGIYEYKSASFKKSNRVTKVSKNKVLKVKALVTDNGVARYQLTNGKYVTANSKYVRNAYYLAKHSVIYVKSAKGINEYNKVNLTSKIKHLKMGNKLYVKQIVLNKYTSRFELTNGNFVTGNSKLISINR